MNPFANWSIAEVDAFNERVKAGKRTCDALPQPLPAAPSKRIRQSAAPLMNKLEAQWFAILSAQCPNYPRPRAQAVRLKLCNGVVYTPDFFAFDWPHAGRAAGPTAWEAKGKHAWDDAIVKVKMAAHEWPEVKFILVFKDKNGKWQEQEVLP